MEFNGSESTGREEERESLMINSYGGGISAVKVVEYMISSMSTELLCKFPDNSAFDFDYTQSSIWSPLVPHPSNPSSPAPDLQRKLSYDDDDHGGDGTVWHNSSGGDTMSKLTENVKNKIADSCVFSCFKIHHKISNKKTTMKRRSGSFRGYNHFGSMCSNSSGVVADPACSSPIQSKGWKKVLKAASKQFKKTMKKKESGAHLKLSHFSYNYFY
ncbi:hypothetical protein L2E82_27401 [Cichorium intybus]|uniref:Uncharacterized protein n=1 Tax=Cichorium intybus TaxID=13427 RepID=A0ACB9CT02_CICIN|nr:hypothetical protein L2E82_27401 [Cichorium intybus]